MQFKNMCFCLMVVFMTLGFNQGAIAALSAWPVVFTDDAEAPTVQNPTSTQDVQENDEELNDTDMSFGPNPAEDIDTH